MMAWWPRTTADLERISSGSIYRNVQLGDGHQVADAVRELGVGDQEGGDAALVQLVQDGVDLGVHDGLPHQRQRTVPHLHQVLQLKINLAVTCNARRYFCWACTNDVNDGLVFVPLQEAEIKCLGPNIRCCSMIAEIMMGLEMRQTEITCCQREATARHCDQVSRYL